MAEDNLLKCERRVLALDAPMSCPACGAQFDVDVESVDVELGDRDSVGVVHVSGRAGCRRCYATWRFSGPYRPIDFAIELD